LDKLIIISLLFFASCARYPLAPVICAHDAAAMAASYARTGYRTVVVVGDRYIPGAGHAQAAIMLSPGISPEHFIPLQRWSRGMIGPGKWDDGFTPISWCDWQEYGRAIYGPLSNAGLMQTIEYQPLTLERSKKHD
jgi:hypothetical protein